MMLEDDGYPEMQVIEIDHELLIKACKNYGYNYTVISANDIVIPPRSNKNDFI